MNGGYVLLDLIKYGALRDLGDDEDDIENNGAEITEAEYKNIENKILYSYRSGKPLFVRGKVYDGVYLNGTCVYSTLVIGQAYTDGYSLSYIDNTDNTISHLIILKANTGKYYVGCSVGSIH